MSERRETVIITGSSGFIGEALVARLATSFNVIGLDRQPPKRLPSTATFEEVDLTSNESLHRTFANMRKRHRDRIASVIHLAAYFDLTGEPDLKYEEITVRGTARLLRELQKFEVEQFIFASSMLVHRAGRPGDLITEDWPLEAKLPYRSSKIETEQLIRQLRGEIPVVYLRPAGVYDDLCRNPFLAHQVAYLIGALLITVAVCAMAEVARPLRFINLLFGLWLITAPWLLAGAMRVQL
jgi:nucleoside-diphosphate-sugar epimerase